MATWPPVSVRRSGCWAASATGDHKSAAIERALIRDLLRRGVLTALRAPGGTCFTTVLQVGWGEPRKGCGNRQPRRRRPRGRRPRNYRRPAGALTSPHARMASLARRLPAVVRGRDARARLLAAVGGRRLPGRRGRLPGRPGGGRAGAHLRRGDPPVPGRYPSVPAPAPAPAWNRDPDERGCARRPGGDRVGARRPRDR